MMSTTFKYDQNKTLEWLEEKVTNLVETLKVWKINVSKSSIQPSLALNSTRTRREVPKSFSCIHSNLSSSTESRFDDLNSKTVLVDEKVKERQVKFRIRLKRLSPLIPMLMK
jgi:hypothetical protein